MHLKGYENIHKLQEKNTNVVRPKQYSYCSRFLVLCCLFNMSTRSIPAIDTGTNIGLYSGYGLSQWEAMLHCNVVSHWLSPYLELSLSNLRSAANGPHRIRPGGTKPQYLYQFWLIIKILWDSVTFTRKQCEIKYPKRQWFKLFQNTIFKITAVSLKV